MLIKTIVTKMTSILLSNIDFWQHYRLESRQSAPNNNRIENARKYHSGLSDNRERLWKKLRGPLSRSNAAGGNARENPNTLDAYYQQGAGTGPVVFGVIGWAGEKKSILYALIHEKPTATVTRRALRDKYDIIASAGRHRGDRIVLEREKDNNNVII